MNFIGSMLVNLGFANEVSGVSAEDMSYVKESVILPLFRTEADFIMKNGSSAKGWAFQCVFANWPHAGDYEHPEFKGPWIPLYEGGPFNQSNLHFDDLLLLSRTRYSEEDQFLFQLDDQALYVPSEKSINTIIMPNDKTSDCIGFLGTIMFPEEDLNLLVSSGSFAEIPYNEEIVYNEDRANIWRICIEIARARRAATNTPTRPFDTMSTTWGSAEPGSKRSC